LHASFTESAKKCAISRGNEFGMMFLIAGAATAAALQHPGGMPRSIVEDVSIGGT
jgi:hypothetical protein